MSTFIKNVIIVIAFLIGLIVILYIISDMQNKKTTIPTMPLTMPPTIPPTMLPTMLPTMPPMQTVVIPVQEETNRKVYKKYDEIILPSNISGTDGYIGRDSVCFRKKFGDTEFMSKRPGCMACQVDAEEKYKKYYGTNVISTCLYSNDVNSTDSNIFSKMTCESKCKELKDN